jgi:hypothetical protein
MCRLASIAIWSTGRTRPKGTLNCASPPTSSRVPAQGRPPEPRLRARQHTTVSAEPVSIAMAAWPTAAAAPSAVADLAEEAQVRDPEIPCDLDFRGRLHVEAHQPVHLRGREPRVAERQLDRLDRGPDFAPADVLRELDLADPGDRNARHGYPRVGAGSAIT